jgi:chromate transporter
MTTTTTAIERGRIGELVRYFLRLGCLGFGGPVALVGQMERELVDGKKWLSKEQMREAIAICQSLPGPLAIQVGVYISYLRGGFWGAWAGGWAFILPNFISSHRWVHSTSISATCSRSPPFSMASVPPSSR